MDFLRSQGYDIHESGDQGRDGGWDARAEIADQSGIAHASVRNDWRAKLRDDAKKVEHLEENESGSYDIFIFVTNQHVSGEQELKIQSGISDDYGWRLKIHHKNNILGELRQNEPELAEAHFDMELGNKREHLEKIESLQEERLDKIQNREGDAEDLKQGPVAALHILPTSIFSKSTTISADFPSPRVLGDVVSAKTEKQGKQSKTYEHRGSGYAILRNDGLYETAAHSLFTENYDGEVWVNSSISGSKIGLDAAVVIAVKAGLNDLSDIGYSGTALVSLSLLDAEKAILTRPNDQRRLTGNNAKFGSQRYSTEITTIGIREQEVIGKVEPMISEVWRQFGYENGTGNIVDGRWDRGRVTISQETLLEEGEK